MVDPTEPSALAMDPGTPMSQPPTLAARPVTVVETHVAPVRNGDSRALATPDRAATMLGPICDRYLGTALTMSGTIDAPNNEFTHPGTASSAPPTRRTEPC